MDLFDIVNVRYGGHATKEERAKATLKVGLEVEHIHLSIARYCEEEIVPKPPRYNLANSNIQRVFSKGRVLGGSFRGNKQEEIANGATERVSKRERRVKTTQRVTLRSL